MMSVVFAKIAPRGFRGGRLRTVPPFNLDEKWRNLKTWTRLGKAQVRSPCVLVWCVMG